MNEEKNSTSHLAEQSQTGRAQPTVFFLFKLFMCALCHKNDSCAYTFHMTHLTKENPKGLCGNNADKCRHSVQTNWRGSEADPCTFYLITPASAQTQKQS